MGVTRERVRQIEARALKKLHKRLGQVFRNENITPDDAMDVVRRVSRGGMECGVVDMEEE
jgi:DNA-directed RNA polymerase sigma subunit (sigma70/sigma32)